MAVLWKLKCGGRPRVKMVIHLNKDLKSRTRIEFRTHALNLKVPSLWKYANLTKLTLEEGNEMVFEKLQFF